MNKTLLLSGLIVVYVGVGMLVCPFEFFNFNSVVSFDYSVDKASEFRGLGTFILLCGLFITHGAILKKHLVNVYLLSIAIYSSFSFGRIASFIIDGAPNQAISLILGLEIIILFSCLISFSKYREHTTN